MLTPNDTILLQALFSNYESSVSIQCPSCFNRDRIHHHGVYWRYHLFGDGMEAIPRYKCLNPHCPRITFSILPFPYLRWIRHRGMHLLVLLSWFLKGKSISALSRWWDRSRITIRRAIFRAKQLNKFLDQEIRAGTSGIPPWDDVLASWTPFTQMVSHHIYPHLQPHKPIPHKSAM